MSYWKKWRECGTITRMSTPQFDFWYAVNNTQIVLMPKRHLETFGNTLFHYHLISEMMDEVGKVRIRTGRMQALKPQIITPNAYMKMVLEGFGDEAHKYAEWLKEHEADMHILRYGYTLKQESFSEQIVTDSIEAVVERVKKDVEVSGDGFGAVLKGVDKPWDVCLIRLFWHMVQTSAKANIMELAQRRMFEMKDGLPVPIREEIAGRSALWPPVPEKKTILVMGGSQGARAINSLTVEAVQILMQRQPRQWRVLHLAGRAEEEAVRQAYEDLSLPMKDIDVCGFMTDMGGIYASSDFCICRSGASSCFELALCGPIPIFIPLPTAVRDHQTANAKAFADKGAAILMPQKDLTAQQLAQKLMELRQQERACNQMRDQLRAMAQPNAAANLADVVEKRDE